MFTEILKHILIASEKAKDEYFDVEPAAEKLYKECVQLSKKELSVDELFFMWRFLAEELGKFPYSEKLSKLVQRCDLKSEFHRCFRGPQE